jgi:2-dehydropantoate 2-reductase
MGAIDRWPPHEGLMMDDANARIGIVGAGAMGCLFGAKLAAAGADVALLDVSQPLVDRINADGVTVVRDGVEQTVAIHAETSPEAVGPVGAAIVFVKCYHTRAAAELMRPLVGATTGVATLQNGWGNERVLADVFGAERVAAGVTYHSSTTLGPGRLSHNAPGPTFIGPYEGSDSGPWEPLAEALSAAGIETTAMAEARTEVWKKLVFNAAGLAVGALTGLDPRSMVAEDAVRDLVFSTAREAVDVARACGYEIAGDERVESIARAFAATAPGTKGSMIQDIEAHRQTEVDVINGAVVAEAQAHDHAAPLNRALLALVKGKEAAQRQSTPAP